jgi:hypothetical protein
MGELAMIGDVFRISLPQSKVSNYFEQKPELVFYPYFFATEGDFETLQVKSDDEAIGTRQMVIYLPPGIRFLVFRLFNSNIYLYIPQSFIKS